MTHEPHTEATQASVRSSVERLSASPGVSLEGSPALAAHIGSSFECASTITPSGVGPSFERLEADGGSPVLRPTEPAVAAGEVGGGGDTDGEGGSPENGPFSGDVGQDFIAMVV